MMLRYLIPTLLMIVACAKDHEATPVKEGDGVQNSGGSYQFYSARDPLFEIEQKLFQANIFDYLEIIDRLQHTPYDCEAEQIWVATFDKYQRLGLSKLAEINSKHDWLSIADKQIPVTVVAGLYDKHTGNPIMATNFTKPAEIYIAPHLWIEGTKANIIPCAETYDLELCQAAQLATIAVHEKLGALGFVEERTGHYEFSSLVYKRIIDEGNQDSSPTP